MLLENRAIANRNFNFRFPSFFTGMPFGVLHKPGLCSVKGEGQQPVAIWSGIHRFNPILLCEGLA